MCTVSYTAGRHTTSEKSISYRSAGLISTLVSRVVIWAEQQGIDSATLLLYRALLSFAFSKHTSHRSKEAAESNRFLLAKERAEMGSGKRSRHASWHRSKT